MSRSSWLCAPGSNASEKSSFDESDKNANKKIKWKIDQGKPSKKANHEVLKRRGGIENVPSGSHVPNINQSYKISRQLNKGTTDAPNW